MAHPTRTRFNVREFRQENQTVYENSAAALAAAGMNWDVALEGLTTDSGQNAPAKAVIRTDTRKPLGVVGLRYTPLNNVESSQWVDRYRAYGLQVTGAESFRGGERNALYASVNGPAEVKKGDAVALQLVASWSHDGTSSTAGFLRIIRLVCTNGLCMATDAGRMFSLRHTRNADPSADAIQRTVQAALEQFHDTVGVFRNLSERPADRAQVREYIREVLEMEKDAVTGALSTRSTNVLDSIVARYDDSRAAASQLIAESQERERLASANILEDMVSRFDGAGIGSQMPSSAGTWWGAYNAITEHLTHDRGAKAENRQESLLFGSARTINERALGQAMHRAGIA